MKSDNNMIFRTILIIVAAFVLFALVNYYNNKQSTVKSEKFYNEAMASQAGTGLSMGSASVQGSAVGQASPTQRTANAQLMERYTGPAPQAPRVSLSGGQPAVGLQSGVQPSDPLGDIDFRAVDYEGKKLPSDCFPKDRMTVDDLLPKDAANSKWAQVNPAGQGDVKDQNFLTAGYMFGINTVGSSLKNANLQLRSEPVIPKVSVGPFLNSSYEASDALRRPLEIGGDC
jgi:hypothetical protein